VTVAGRVGRAVRVTIAAPIGREDREVGAEQGRDLAPHLAVARETVEGDQREAVPREVVGHVDPVHVGTMWGAFHRHVPSRARPGGRRGRAMADDNAGTASRMCACRAVFFSRSVAIWSRSAAGARAGYTPPRSVTPSVRSI